MSSEALYEKYKDALKRGHVAALRGHVDEALVAYAEAARIAPERSTPHSSAGTALLRRKRPGEALRHYEVALKIAPRDEAALLGRAQSLAAVGRRGEAADAFDALAEVQAANGKLADAVDAARKGLEMAEGRERRRTLERLIARLRASEPGEPGRVALERALQVLDGVAVPHVPAKVAPAPKPQPKPVNVDALEAAAVAEAVTADEAFDAEPGEAAVADEAAGVVVAADAPAVEVASAEARTADVAAEPDSEAIAAAELIPPDAESEAEPRAVEAGPVDEAAVAAASPEATGEVDAAQPATVELEVDDAAEPAESAAGGAAIAESVAEVEVEAGASAESAEAEIEPTLPAAREIPEGATSAELTARAEAAIESGVPMQAVDALLDLAALHARDGRIDAALDACYSAVTFDPDNVALHLALAELYGERGWTQLMTEKLDLLARIGQLDGDQAALADVAGVRAALS